MRRNDTSTELIRRAYEAFNRRDLDAALAVMHPDVDWPNAIDGGRVHGHEDVHRYWSRQFELIDPRVEPRDVSTDERGRIVVDVRQVVRDLEGTVIADERVQHVYAIRDGLIARMDIRRGAATTEARRMTSAAADKQRRSHMTAMRDEFGRLFRSS